MEQSCVGVILSDSVQPQKAEVRGTKEQVNIKSQEFKQTNPYTYTYTNEINGYFQVF